MLRKLTFLTTLLLFIPLMVASVRAQGIKAEYTERNGARAIGMGHAFTGVAEGMPTVLWNPAGLANLNRTEVYFSRYEGWSFTYDDPLTGGQASDQISFNFFNVGAPIAELGTVAFSVNLWDLGSSQSTDYGQDNRGLDSQSLMTLYGSYATHLTKKVDFGVTMKYTREKLASSQGGTGTSAALDLGVLYRPLSDIPLQLGMSLLDLGTDVQFKNEYQSDRLPRRVRVGAGYNILKHLLDQDRFNLLLAMDYERFLVGNPANDGVFAGTEFSIEPLEDLLLAMRAGYQSETGDLSGALFGFGVNWKGYSFDIARELGVLPTNDRTFFALSAHF